MALKTNIFLFFKVSSKSLGKRFVKVERVSSFVLCWFYLCGTMIFTSPHLASENLKLLNNLRLNNEYCDITINVQGRNYPAHKAVLVASSPYFRKFIPRNVGNMFNIKLSLSKPENFDDILRYMYTCEIDLCEETVAEIILLGTFLQISEISTITSKYINGMQNFMLQDDDITTDKMQVATNNSSSEYEKNMELMANTVQFIVEQNSIASANNEVNVFSNESSNSESDVRLSNSRKRHFAAIDLQPTAPKQRYPINRKSGFLETTDSNIPHFNNGSVDGQSDPNNTNAVAETKMYQCTFCWREFKNRANCVRHYRSLHTGQRPYQCLICKSHFARHDSFKSHSDICRRTLQKDIKFNQETNQYQCPHCQRSFREHSPCIKHVRTHIEKPYKCSLCRAQFARPESCHKHKKTCKGPPPMKKALFNDETNLFHCTHCQRGFSDRSNCLRHYKLHTGQKPHKCPTCLSVFSNLDVFKNHLAICESPDPPPAPEQPSCSNSIPKTEYNDLVDFRGITWASDGQSLDGWTPHERNQDDVTSDGDETDVWGVKRRGRDGSVGNAPNSWASNEQNAEHNSLWSLKNEPIEGSVEPGQGLDNSEPKDPLAPDLTEETDT